MIGSISLQERLQMKREPLDKWSIREKLCLATAVMRSGDQNWMSVSRTLKPFGEPNRPADWFHQKNCAAQYGVLLEQIETPKRIKKRSTGSPIESPLLETPAESILKNLQLQRQEELKQLLIDEKREYLKLQEDLRLLQSGQGVSDEQLDEWCLEIENEEKQKDLENAEYSAWLKEREQRKQELERAWRPLARPSLIGQQHILKRKSDSLDPINTSSPVTPHKSEGDELKKSPAISPETPSKPALSPLLTSLLKSPSHQQQNQLPLVNSSILHSAITQHQIHQNQTKTTPTINPTIASLLNSSATVTVSPGIQQLVTTAISQPQIEPTPSTTPILTPKITNDLATSVSDLLSDSEVPNLKDIEKTISIDHPLPEMKNEEVDTIISDLIDNNDIVTDPEKHLLDVNDDDIINSLENELEELANEEKAAIAFAAAAIVAESATNATVELPNEPTTIKPVLDNASPELDVSKANLQPVVVLNIPDEMRRISEHIALVEKVEGEVDVVVQKIAAPPEKVEILIEVKEKAKVEIDPFEFQEDPEIQPSKPSAGLKLVNQQSQNQAETKSTNDNILAELNVSKISKDNVRLSTELSETVDRKKSVITDVAEVDQQMAQVEKVLTGGSVEIVEVDIMEDEENSSETYSSKSSEDKELIPKTFVETTEVITAKSAIKEESSIIEEKSIVLSPIKLEPIACINNEEEEEDDEEEVQNESEELNISKTSSNNDSKIDSVIDSKPKINDEPTKEDIKKVESIEDIAITADLNDSADDLKKLVPDVEVKRENIDSAVPSRNTFTPDYSNSGDIFDDMNIEVKVGKVKRDYSRTKKKEETDFDLLLAVEKAVGDTLDDDNTSEPTPTTDKPSKTPTKPSPIPDIKPKIKLTPDTMNTTDDSNSTWTEEEEPLSASHMRTRRRYSTPATPVDSVPSSPASSFDDDRDYRNWRKAVLLVHGRLAMHKYASLFMKGVTNELAPNYHDLVYKPMDLHTIRKNIDSGNIRTNSEFHRDVLLMFANAIMYNDYGSQIYEMALEMRREAQEQIQILFQAQFCGDSGPSRRETRTCPVTADQQQQVKRKRSGIAEDAGKIVKKRKDE